MFYGNAAKLTSQMLESGTPKDVVLEGLMKSGFGETEARFILHCALGKHNPIQPKVGKVSPKGKKGRRGLAPKGANDATRRYRSWLRSEARTVVPKEQPVTEGSASATPKGVADIDDQTTWTPEALASVKLRTKDGILGLEEFCRRQNWNWNKLGGSTPKLVAKVKAGTASPIQIDYVDLIVKLKPTKGVRQVVLDIVQNKYVVSKADQEAYLPKADTKVQPSTPKGGKVQPKVDKVTPKGVKGGKASSPKVKWNSDTVSERHNNMANWVDYVKPAIEAYEAELRRVAEMPKASRKDAYSSAKAELKALRLTWDVDGVDGQPCGCGLGTKYHCSVATKGGLKNAWGN